jgi:molybdopterin synthase catalytic subunit
VAVDHCPNVSESAVGAVTSFVVYGRDEDGRLAALELEYYSGMAEAEIGRVVKEAVARWPLMAVTVVHRGGRIKGSSQKRENKAR